MVKLCIEDFLSAIENLKGCRVFCFGGGKIFRAVLPKLGELNIEGVIDNYLSRDKKEIKVDERDFDVISFNRYLQIAEKDDVILITSLYYREILQQLDGEWCLEGERCYLAAKPSEREFYELIKNRELTKGRKSITVSETDGYHFQIWEYITDNMHAGSKAPRDVRDILVSMGYAPINIHVELCADIEKDRASDWRRNRSKEEWESCVANVPAGSVLVLQNPFRVENIYREMAILELKKKGVKIVSIVHDIESIRGLNSSEYYFREEEFMMKTADVIIIQNSKMREYMAMQWPGEWQIVELGIFDYLAEGEDIKEAVFDKKVSFAGSLEYRKSPFIYMLGELAETRFVLYGPDFEKDRFDGGVIPKNLEYKGSYPPEVMPYELNRGFGLVWEGEEINTCDKGTGHYLTMNSPHKLSLYLASGLPVIIWDKAAMAKFVLENNVGFTVSSLYQLEEKLKEVTEEDYAIYACNARKIGHRLRNGEFTMAALKEAEGKTMS